MVVDEIVVSTVVYLPPKEVYEFLIDFPRYANYSKHLTRVRQAGDGSPGTRYSLRFSWWKLTYTAESEVTGVEPPTRIDWKILKDIHAFGCWRIEQLDELPKNAPMDAETACRVYLDIEYDPNSVSEGSIDLPRFVSLRWVIDRVKPILEKEAERIVERIVADIEGRRRHVEITIHTKSRP